MSVLEAGAGPSRHVQVTRPDLARVRLRQRRAALQHWTRAVFQANGGIADPDRGNPAHQGLAVAAGAELRERVRVTAINDHGGELEVHSSPGNGTRFTLVLPCFQAS